MDQDQKALLAEVQEMQDDVNKLTQDLADLFERGAAPEEINSRLSAAFGYIEHRIRHVRELRQDELIF